VNNQDTTGSEGLPFRAASALKGQSNINSARTMRVGNFTAEKNDVQSTASGFLRFRRIPASVRVHNDLGYPDLAAGDAYRLFF